jgi:predicted nucleotidyltransferase
MDEESVLSSCVLRVRHGSHAYGLNTPESDVDEKGICIIDDPLYYYGIRSFEQKDSGWSDGVDRVIYDIRKFFKLALQCNPNIIEVLHVNDEDVLEENEIGQILREQAGMFLSRRAAKSFVGYAVAQLKRIKSHKKWIDHPPVEPNKEDFVHRHCVTAKDWKREFDNHHIRVLRGSHKAVIIEHFDEGAYKQALRKQQQYLSWKKNRNRARYALEEQFGYDSKHAMHLMRLLRMGIEILRDGKVVVKRPDREELLAIRNGKFKYDELVVEADKMIKNIDALTEKSSLPEQPNVKEANRLLSEILRAVITI